MITHVPFSAGFLQFVFEHENLFLECEVLSLSIVELLLEALQLAAVECLPATQLLLVLHVLLFQLRSYAHQLLLLV